MLCVGPADDACGGWTSTGSEIWLYGVCVFFCGLSKRLQQVITCDIPYIVIPGNNIY